jgi:hypothetical protein
MRQSRVLRAAIALAALAAVGWLAGASRSLAAADVPEQVRLDETTVERMISASRAVFEVREQAGSAQGEAEEESAEGAEDLTPEETAQLESVVKKHGFKSLAEFDAVSGSVMTALMRVELDDPQMVAEIKEEIGRIEADDEIPKDAKNEMLASLRRQLDPPEVRFPENVDVVRPFRDDLRALLEGGEPAEEGGE